MKDIEKLLADVSALIEKENMNVFDFAVDDGENVHRIKFREANPCNNSYSVAKAFTMVAVGMLVDEGKLSVSDKITDILAEEFSETPDREEKWSEVTLDNVLSHKIGLSKGFLDIDTEDASAYGTDDYLQYAFMHKIDEPPGERRVYSDAAYYIASRVVEKVSGEKLSDFLWKRLFYPLGFREVSWSTCPKGHSMGATGLYIRTVDMLKLARTLLDGGVWKGARIVSAEWIKHAEANGYDLYPVADKNAFTKGGMKGQRMYYSYGDGIAVAWHGYESSKLTDMITKIL